MNTKNMKSFKVIIEKDEEGFFVADVPELEGCHTQAKSKKELLERIKEAISLCLEDKIEIKDINIQEVKVALPA